MLAWYSVKLSSPCDEHCVWKTLQKTTSLPASVRIELPACKQNFEQKFKLNNSRIGWLIYKNISTAIDKIGA